MLFWQIEIIRLERVVKTTCNYIIVNASTNMHIVLFVKVHIGNICFAMKIITEDNP